MRLIRLALVVLAAAGAVVLLAGPLAAQTPTIDSTRSFIVLTGQLDIAEGQLYEDAVIFDGDATIAGSVAKDAVAFNGDVTVSGDVGGSVIALNGQVVLESGARVGGDVVSSEPADIAEGATVGGTTSSSGLPTNFNVGKFVTVSRVAVWVATSVSSLVLGLLLLLFAPRAGEAVATTASSMFGRSVGIGFAVFFGLPIAALIALITLVGIPFGAGLLLGPRAVVLDRIRGGRHRDRAAAGEAADLAAAGVPRRLADPARGRDHPRLRRPRVVPRNGLRPRGPRRRRAARGPDRHAGGRRRMAVPPPPPMPPAVPSAP